MTGFIVFDKPENMTSFLAVNKLRKAIGEKKAGHSGTLDPMATGVLFVAVGGATRFMEFIPQRDKSYIAGLKLGIATDTLDITGNILNEIKTQIDYDAAKKAAESFKGKIMQIPPMYSALKKDGVRLYDLARKGIEVERQERQVEIYKIEIMGFDYENQEFSIEVDCSSGTYIRTLAEDIGKKLGVPAVLTSLRRTKANGFGENECHSLDEIKEAVEKSRIEEILLPVDRVMGSYPEVFVSTAQAVRFSNGGELFLDRIKSKMTDGIYRVYSPDKSFLGLGLCDMEKNSLFVKRVYNEI